MRLALIAVAAVLAGCQTTPNINTLRVQAGDQSDYNICHALVTGNPTLRQVASEEMQRRRLDCNPYMGTINAQAQQDRARAMMGLQLLQQAQPQPVPVQPIPQPIRCTSRNVLGTVQTVCN